MTAREIASLTLGLGVFACASPATPPEDDLPRAGPGVLYAIGASLGGQIAMYQLDEDDAREVARGLTDTATREPYAAPRGPETPGLVGSFHQARLEALARREERAGAFVLEAAAREPGAVLTESGMVLRVIERGSGPSPGIWDYVTLNYHGTLRDGKVFHTNRGQPPLRVQLGTATRCWQQALGAVAAGGRLHVVCPPALGYGPGGWSDVAPGGAVLTYDLELLSVEPTPEPKL